MLTPAMKGAVKRYEEYCENTFAADDALNQPIIVNLIQRPTFVQPSVGIAPALLRTSSLWSIPARRLVAPLEYFEIQGYNMFDTDSSRCSFADTLHTVSDRKVRQLAGNGMHQRAVAAVLIFVMACSVKESA